MGLLDTLIYGYRTAYAATVELTRRNKINFGAGITATDDPVNRWTNLTAAAASTPTGDGFRRVTGGIEDAAAVLIDLDDPAHVDAASILPVANGGTALSAIGAALEVLRVNGAGTLLEYAANVPTMPGAVANEVITTDGAGAAQATSGVRAITDAIEIGTAPVAGAGAIRLPSATPGAVMRNVADTDDLYVFDTDATDQCFFGTDRAFTAGKQFAYAYHRVATSLFFGIAAADLLRLNATELQSGVPIIGYGTPHGVHGSATIDIVDADYTMLAAQYQNQVVTIDPTTPMTADRTVYFPDATDAASYVKFVRNTNGGAFNTIVQNVSLGTTVTIADGFGAWVGFHAAGAYRMGADVAN